MPSCAKHRMISAVDGLNLKVEQVYTGVPLLPPPPCPAAARNAPSVSLACGLANIQSVCPTVAVCACAQHDELILKGCVLVGKAVRQKVLDLRARPAAEAQTILRERYDCPSMLELEQMSPNTFDRQ